MIIRSCKTANDAGLISAAKIHFQYKVMLSPDGVKRIQRKDHRKKRSKDRKRRPRMNTLSLMRASAEQCCKKEELQHANRRLKRKRAIPDADADAKTGTDADNVTNFWPLDLQPKPTACEDERQV